MWAFNELRNALSKYVDPDAKINPCYKGSNHARADVPLSYLLLKGRIFWPPFCCQTESLLHKRGDKCDWNPGAPWTVSSYLKSCIHLIRSWSSITVRALQDSNPRKKRFIWNPEIRASPFLLTPFPSHSLLQSCRPDTLINTSTFSHHALQPKP